MNTKLLYMEHMDQLTCDAVVSDIYPVPDQDTTAIILNQTVLYPQGGGQPYDTGTLEGSRGTFSLQEVRYDPDRAAVLHIGIFTSGSLKVGDTVTCRVDAERRSLHTRLHSAGHLIDLALRKLGIDWKPAKGYHFPQGPYVEYEGVLPTNPDPEIMRKHIEDTCNNLIKQNIQTRLVFDSEKLFNGKPTRTVYYGDFGIPCGGTHVAALGEIGSILIKKVKQDKHVIRVSYSL